MERTNPLILTTKREVDFRDMFLRHVFKISGLFIRFSEVRNDKPEQQHDYEGEACYRNPEWSVCQHRDQTSSSGKGKEERLPERKT